MIWSGEAASEPWMYGIATLTMVVSSVCIRVAAMTQIVMTVRLLKVARPFEADLHRLRIHLRMVQEDVHRMGAAIQHHDGL